MPDPVRYYTEQSPFTDPGANAWMFAELPHDVAGLCHVVQGLIIHYRYNVDNYVIPKERLLEVDTRYVEQMLTRIHELDARPLTEARPPERRLVGCCRDFATLFCAMARYRGIPTRVRIGFAAYFNPSFNHDHEIAEYWDASERRWRLVDPELGAPEIESYHIAFDPRDVPRDQFIVGGLAWQRYRSGTIDPYRYGVEPEGDLNGPQFIMEKLLQDFAALNRREPLLWDGWGLMLKDELDDADRALLDRLASLTQADNAAFGEVRQLYENEPELKLPPEVMCFSPVAKTRRVKLVG